MNPLVKQRYELEHQYKSCMINNVDTTSLEQVSSENLMAMYTENDNLYSFDYGFSIFQDLHIPVSLLRASSGAALNNGKITIIERDIVDSFFKNRFGIDVSEVDIIHSSNIPPHADACAVPCGIKDHFIVIPNNLETTYCSYDILIHEFGHTVEFAEKRKNKNGEITNVLTCSLFSEAIAHYYQIIYMLEHSNKTERLSMLASVTQAYLYTRCMSIMLDVAPDQNFFKEDLILRDERFKDFIQAFHGTTIINKFFERWCQTPMTQGYLAFHAMRFGFFLALNIVKNKLDVTELFKIEFPKGELSVEELIKQTNFNCEIIWDFKTIDETLYQFIDGTLET